MPSGVSQEWGAKTHEVDKIASNVKAKHKEHTKRRHSMEREALLFGADMEKRRASLERDRSQFGLGLGGGTNSTMDGGDMSKKVHKDPLLF